MNQILVDKIVNAVLYEGYILYPYRSSAIKNRQRWNFGTLYPQAVSEAAKGTDAWKMQTECVIEATPDTRLELKIRFLQVVLRQVGQFENPLILDDGIPEPEFVLVDALDVDEQSFRTWQEAVEETIDLGWLDQNEIVNTRLTTSFSISSKREIEYLRNRDGKALGMFIRNRRSIDGIVEVSAEVRNGLVKLTVQIMNATNVVPDAEPTRDEALMQSMVSTHSILHLDGGQFVSLLDPPEAAKPVVSSCVNIGAWPVMVGTEGERDCMLASPIILYDYPEVAPESGGNFFDGTEIDEMLTLRVMTLTDEEKNEMRSVDEHARRILERTESLPMEEMMKLHGAMRSPRVKVQS